MGCFWAAGYAATSVRDLGDAMGVGAASLYNAFGDKRTLFTRGKTLPPRQAIATFLTEIVERSLESRLGCLLANAALEVGPHDPDMPTWWRNAWANWRHSFDDAFSRLRMTAANRPTSTQLMPRDYSSRR